MVYYQFFREIFFETSNAYYLIPGLARHAMAVYERAATAVEKSEKLAIFNIYLKKAAEIYGVTRTREIYEKSIEVLEDLEASEMCLRFTDMETKLGEIDRARAIYGHCSQMCDPRVATKFWDSWKNFEVRHGNEDTLREMLRIKRSIQHQYNTQVCRISISLKDNILNIFLPSKYISTSISWKTIDMDRSTYFFIYFQDSTTFFYELGAFNQEMLKTFS